MRFFLPALLLATVACSTASSSDEAASTGEEAISAGDRRPLWCAMELETFEPAFATVQLGTLYKPWGDVRKSGATAGDADFSLDIVSNPAPAYNLSMNALVRDAAGTELAYVVLPAPKAGGDYLFELGAKIPPVTRKGADGADHAFDHVRAYCTYK